MLSTSVLFAQGQQVTVSGTVVDSSNGEALIGVTILTESMHGVTTNIDGSYKITTQEDAERDAGIRRTTFHTYVNLMIEKGYLIHSKGNCFDFYEIPQTEELTQEEENNGFDF